MNLMDKFANPELVHNLALSEKLAGAGVTTAMGMGVTFIVLAMLWFCIVVVTKIITRPKPVTDGAGIGSSAAGGLQPPSSQINLATADAVPAESSAAVAESMVPAVITAAVAAYEEDRNFIVRKIRRV